MHYHVVTPIDPEKINSKCVQCGKTMKINQPFSNNH